ncbi:MAG: SGNH/GDSL hydrolase family protein, partial [Acidobacteriaceae bacterium]
MNPAKILAPVGLLLAVSLVPAPAAAQASANTQIWIGTWAASQQIPEPQNSLPTDDLRDATLRQIVRISVGGVTLRVHLSNAFGADSLHFTAVHIARPLSPASAAIDPASDKPLTFGGSTDVTIPAGAEYVSDPIDYPIPPLSNLAITFHLDAPPTRETGHPGSRSTSYYLHGDFVSAANLPDAKRIDHWYQLSGIDVLAAPPAGSIVA